MIKKLKCLFVGMITIAVFSLMIAGCGSTWTGVKKDAKEAGEAIEDSYEKTKKKLED